MANFSKCILQAGCLFWCQTNWRTGTEKSANSRQPWHLTFLPQKMDDQDLSCTIHPHLPCLVMICPVVFVLECWHTHTHTHTYMADKHPTSLPTSVWVTTSKHWRWLKVTNIHTSEYNWFWMQVRETLWNPVPEVKARRLCRYTVPVDAQENYESEKWVFEICCWNVRWMIIIHQICILCNEFFTNWLYFIN